MAGQKTASSGITNGVLNCIGLFKSLHAGGLHGGPFREGLGWASRSSAPGAAVGTARQRSGPPARFLLETNSPANASGSVSFLPPGSSPDGQELL